VNDPLRALGACGRYVLLAFALPLGVVFLSLATGLELPGGVEVFLFPGTFFLCFFVAALLLGRGRAPRRKTAAAPRRRRLSGSGAAASTTTANPGPGGPAPVLGRVTARPVAEGYLLVDHGDTRRAVALLAFFAVVWNGMSWSFLVVVLAARAPWWVVAFLLLFGAVGVLLLLALARTVRVALHFAPGELVLTRWPLRLGEEVEVAFRRRTRRAVRVERIDARLVCTESATYRSGTDTITVTEQVREEPLPSVAAVPGATPIEGVWRIRIPAHGPPTFAAHNNRVEWSLKLRLVARDGPSDDSSFRLLVRPEVVT
jgi:hypothetical protein